MTYLVCFSGVSSCSYWTVIKKFKVITWWCDFGSEITDFVLWYCTWLYTCMTFSHLILHKKLTQWLRNFQQYVLQLQINKWLFVLDNWNFIQLCWKSYFFSRDCTHSVTLGQSHRINKIEFRPIKRVTVIDVIMLILQSKPYLLF